MTEVLNDRLAHVIDLVVLLNGIRRGLALAREETGLAVVTEVMAPEHVPLVRKYADELEGWVADDLWPLPTYQEMLFIK